MIGTSVGKKLNITCSKDTFIVISSFQLYFNINSCVTQVLYVHKPYFTTELKNMSTHVKRTKFRGKTIILQNVEGGNEQKRRDITHWVAYRQLSSWRRETCMLPGPSTENVWVRHSFTSIRGVYYLWTEA